MNKAKALLDSLMGPSRNVSTKERTGEDFLQRNVCKHYLVGFCPHNVLGGEIDMLDSKCTRLHSVEMKKEFKSHKDHAKYRKDYEDSLLRLLSDICADADARSVREHKKKRSAENVTRIPDYLNVKIKEYEKSRASLLKIAEEKRAAGDGSGAEHAETEAGRAESQIEHIKQSHSYYFAGEDVCEACGKRYLLGKFGEFQEVYWGQRAGQPIDDHFDTNMHKGFVLIRDKLKEYRDKRQAEGGANGSDKGHDKEKDQEKGGADGSDKGYDQEKDQEKVRGREGDRDGQRQKSRSGRDDERGQDRERADDLGDRRRDDRGREDRRGRDDQGRSDRDYDRYRDRDLDRGGTWRNDDRRRDERRRDDRSRSYDRRRR